MLEKREMTRAEAIDDRANHAPFEVEIRVIDRRDPLPVKYVAKVRSGRYDSTPDDVRKLYGLIDQARQRIMDAIGGPDRADDVLEHDGPFDDHSEVY